MLDEKDDSCELGRVLSTLYYGSGIRWYLVFRIWTTRNEEERPCPTNRFEVTRARLGSTALKTNDPCV